MSEFMDSDDVKRTLGTRGVSKAATQRTLYEEMKRRGVPSASFQYLSRSTQ